MNSENLGLGPSRIDPVLVQLLAQGVPFDPEDLRRPHLIAGRLTQHRAQQRFLDRPIIRS